MSVTPTPPQIVVNKNPGTDALEAFIRQVITVVGAIATVYGFSGFAGKVSLLLAVAGPIATTLAMGWGLVKTYLLADKASKMATMLPDEQAITK